MKFLRVDASLRPESSATRSLADSAERAWRTEHPSAEFTYRDIAANPIPSTAWRDALSGAGTPEGQRSEGQKAALALAAELEAEIVTADALLLAFPLYNYGVSQHVRLWFDLAITAPRTGLGATETKGKPTIVTTALGGNYAPGTPKEGWDHSTPWIRRALQDVCGT